MASAPSEQLKQLRDRAHEMCRTWPLHEVQFSVQTGWAQSYSDIFAAHFTRVLHEEEILDSVLKRGRAILAGRGGDGKTWLLRRLYKQVLDRGDIPVLLDLKQWTGADYETWTEWTSNEIGDAADFLVRRFGGLDLGAIDLDRLPPDASKILLVDGLNEITSAVGAQVLQLLDELVRNQIKLSVLVADRLIRRELPSPTRWSIGTPLPLSEDQVRKHLGDDVEVKPGGTLTSPFFLNAALRYHVEGQRRSQASESFLIVHGEVKEEDLDRTAAAAFDAYKRTRSRVFDRAPFVELAGEAATTALERSSTLVSAADGTSYFTHHILHDYLAARHFAQWPARDWTPRALSQLSFDSSSFDTVGLVFEQLDEKRADLFLRQLYDWNLYAAGYALAQAHDADGYVGPEIRTMIFAMLAEKRFDVILATRQKADDALALMQLSDARPFFEAPHLEEVFSALSAIRSNEEWFNNWRRLFQIDPDSIMSVETLASIRMPDSIAGWTVANVAKRSIVEGDAPNLLANWVQDDLEATARWRIAHVLGAYPTHTAFETLVCLLDDDPDGNVRYGAIRSLIELAARADDGLRDTVSDAVGARAETISKQPKISGELRTCLLVDASRAGPGWLSFVAKVVRALFVAIDDTTERDLWRGCLNEAERLYANRDNEQRPSEPPQGGLYG